MAFTFGAHTACLHDRTLEEALVVLRGNGLAGAEVNVGGFIPSPHCPVDLLLASGRARRDYLATFVDHGMKLTGMNAAGNPLSPLPGVGPKHGEDLRNAIRLAGLLDVLDYQWSILVPFWKDIDALARANGVRLGGKVFHVHAKDTKVFPGAGLRGVLDTSFTRVPDTAESKTPTGIGFYCNDWPTDPAWRFVALGLGHDVDYWTRFLRALVVVDPDMFINVEHEDASLGQLEGLALSAQNLLTAAAHL